MLCPMAFTEQVVVFELPLYAGLNFAVPANLNPSGYDLVDVVVEEDVAAAADASMSSIQQRSTNWAVVSGLTAVQTFGAGQGGGTRDNAVVALPVGNRGTVTAGGAWAALFIATPTNVRVRATLEQASGGAQGQR